MTRKIRTFLLILVIALILPLTGCESKTTKTERILANKERLDNTYNVEYVKTNVENSDKTLSIHIKDDSIKVKDGMVLLVYYNLSLPSRNYILYFNHDKSIPARFYYPVEPIRMLYEDKKEYENYEEELEKVYQEILTELGMTSDDLFDIAFYMYENK